MIKLKNCPTCGKSPKLHCVATNSYYYRCSNFTCLPLHYKIYDDEAAARKGWNEDIEAEID